MQARGPAHGGRRGPFPPLPMGGKRSRASTPQPLGHGGAQARTSTPQPWPAYAGQVQKTKAPEGNRENEGHRTTPGFKPSPAAAGEGGGATGKGDGKGKGGGETRPTADAGDGKAAEGKGDVEGNDDPAGFQPSPADAGQGKGAKVNGDKKVQAKLGFQPSPANAKKLQRRMLGRLVMRGWGWMRPTESLTQEATPLALSMVGGPGAPPKRARGTPPSAPPRDVDVGPTGAGQPPREINPRKLCRTRGLTSFTRGRNAVPVLAWSKFLPPPHMVTVAKKEMPPRPRTPSP